MRAIQTTMGFLYCRDYLAESDQSIWCDVSVRQKKVRFLDFHSSFVLFVCQFGHQFYGQSDEKSLVMAGFNLTGHYPAGSSYEVSQQIRVGRHCSMVLQLGGSYPIVKSISVSSSGVVTQTSLPDRTRSKGEKIARFT